MTNDKRQSAIVRTTVGRLIGRFEREVANRRLTSCGVVVRRGGDGEFIQVGSLEYSAEDSRAWVYPLRKSAAQLSGCGFRVLADPGCRGLLLSRGDRNVLLPRTQTLVVFLSAVLKYWDTVQVDANDSITAIADVVITGDTAHTTYHGNLIEYELEPNWAAHYEGLEKVLFWTHLLPNYHYRIGRPCREDTVFDVGACSGLFSLASALDVGSQGRVFCFEPDKTNLTALESNIGRNRLRNIEIVTAGIGGRSEKRAFVSSGGLGSHLAERGGDGREPVQIYTLADACNTIGGSPPAFIKADIEGAELEMVEPQVDWIGELCATVFAIASYHIVNGEPTRIRLESAFRKAGYNVSTAKEGHQTTVAWRAHAN